MMAAAEGHRDAVAVLLEQGADIAMKDDFQLNALDHARRGQHEEVFQLMARSPAWVLKQADEGLLRRIFRDRRLGRLSSKRVDAFVVGFEQGKDDFRAFLFHIRFLDFHRNPPS